MTHIHIPTDIYEKKKHHLERLKQKLVENETVFKIAERKARTRRLIELGGLVKKAGLHNYEPNLLLGALLSLQPKLSDPEQTKTWQSLGGSIFAKDHIHKEPLIIRFHDKPPAELRAQIRGLGLRWNAVRQEWQGIVEREKVLKVLEGQRGEWREVEK